MIITLFRSKYTSWTLALFFILAIILNETMNISACWILLAIELLSIYSVGYYVIENYRNKFTDKLSKYNLGVFAVTSVVFLIALIDCKFD